jgi:hypothetical protein
MTDDENLGQTDEQPDFWDDISTLNEYLAVVSKQMAADLNRQLFEGTEKAIMGLPIVESDAIDDDSVLMIRRPGFDPIVDMSKMKPREVTNLGMYNFVSTTRAMDDMSWAVNYAAMAIDDFGQAVSTWPFRLRPWHAYAVLAVVLLILTIMVRYL